MKKYTIGIAFYNDFEKVLLIKKIKPEWQKNRWNFPGGSCEVGEYPLWCVVKEFKEECNFHSETEEWTYVGFMENQYEWKVSIYALKEIGKRIKEIKSLTKEKVKLFNILGLPEEKLSNVRWLCELAINVLKPGVIDRIVKVEIQYVELKNNDPLKSSILGGGGK